MHFIPFSLKQDEIHVSNVDQTLIESRLSKRNFSSLFQIGTLNYSHIFKEKNVSRDSIEGLTGWSHIMRSCVLTPIGYY